MPRHEATPEEVESIDAAAQRLDVGGRTIRRWVAEGRVRGYRLGPRQLRVSSADLDALLEPLPTVDAG